MKPILLATALLGSISAFGQTVTAPEIINWKLNNGETDLYYTQGSSQTQSYGFDANCQLVQYNTNNVYVSATGIPDYPVGPYLDGNPSTAGEQGYVWVIPRNPTPATNPASTSLGAIGVLINGVPIYNASDAMSYQNQGNWWRNAVYFEADGFDCSGGHPAPNFQGDLDEGFYHNHQNPTPFSTQTNPGSNICDQYPSTGLYTPMAGIHSPLIGYARDGYPIYGSFGYSDPNDPNSPVVRIETSYQLRNQTARTTLPDGTVAAGPPIDNTSPLGSYIEDYEYVANSGHLDQYNGRVCVTPEYPGGTYAYFAVVNADLQPVYPFFIGPTYYGNVGMGTFGNGNVPGGVDTWNGVIDNVTENYLSSSVSTYPNPATNNVSIANNGGEMVQVQVVNATGQEVIRQTNVAPGLHPIDITNLTPGLYFMVLSQGEQQLTQKLIKL